MENQKKNEKWIVVAVALLMGVGGGVYLWMSSRPTDLSSLDLPSEMLQPLPPQGNLFGNWSAAARSVVASNPDGDGLLRYLNALESVNSEAVTARMGELKEIVEEGWKESRPEIEALLESESKAIQAAEAAADSPPFAMPAATDMYSPIPDMNAAQRLSLLLLVKARKLEAEGKPNEAAREAARAMRFSERLRARGTTMIEHLIGIASSTREAKVLESLLNREEQTSDTLREILSSLEQMDRNQVGIGETSRTEARMNLNMIRRAAEDSDYRKSVLAMFKETDRETEKALRRAIRDPYTYAAEQKKVVDALVAYLDKPYWERKASGGMASLQPLTSNRILIEALTGSREEIAVRFDVAKTHLRLCMALCARGLGDDARLETLIDPFTGKAIRVSPDSAYSLGPDQTDESGATVYDPTNGTESGGDLVARPGL